LRLCSAAFVNVVDCNATPFTVYGAKVPAYTTVDIGARMPMGWAGLNDDTYLQFNITNLFDKLYVGNFGGQLLNTSAPFVQIGAPRAFILTLNVAYR
jgi:iron complex outermembrane receptor protein